MVSEWMKRWMIAGLGMAALTKEKIEEIVQELVRSGDVDGEQSKQLARSILKQAEEQRGELRRVVEQQVKRVLTGAGLVTKEEYQALEARVKALESQLAGADPAERAEAEGGDAPALDPSER